MIVGITGTFGSGKSAVVRILAKVIKIKIIDADKIAKTMLNKRGVKQQVGRLFPGVVIKGRVNRKGLAAIVFRDKRRLLILEKIIHPLVIKEIKRKIKGNAIIDVPLLIEAKLHNLCDIIIVVKCNEHARIKRLMKKGFAKEEIMARTRMQLPLRKKLAHADFIIDNSSSVKETERQIKQIARKLFP